MFLSTRVCARRLDRRVQANNVTACRILRRQDDPLRITVTRVGENRHFLMVGIIKDQTRNFVRMVNAVNEVSRSLVGGSRIGRNFSALKVGVRAIPMRFRDLVVVTNRLFLSHLCMVVVVATLNFSQRSLKYENAAKERRRDPPCRRGASSGRGLPRPSLFYAKITRATHSTFHVVRAFRLFPYYLLMSNRRRLNCALPILGLRQFKEGIRRGSARLTAVINVGHAKEIRRHGTFLRNRATAQASLHLHSIERNGVGANKRRAAFRQLRRAKDVRVNSRIRANEIRDNVL